MSNLNFADFSEHLFNEIFDDYAKNAEKWLDFEDYLQNAHKRIHKIATRYTKKLVRLVIDTHYASS